VPQPRNPLTLLFIGIALGGILGAVIGIAIGSGARSSSALGPVRTVVSTRTIRVARPVPVTSPALTNTTSTRADTTPTTTDTTTTDTTATDTTPLDTTSTDLTATDTSPATTTAPIDAAPGPRDPNDVPPRDPYNPPRNFCATHLCAPGFSRGTGFVVQCSDGLWAMDGGDTHACRNDGGVA
jgi:hypothetical protein